MKFSGQAFHGAARWSSCFSCMGRGDHCSIHQPLQRSGKARQAETLSQNLIILLMRRAFVFSRYSLVYLEAKILVWSYSNKTILWHWLNPCILLLNESLCFKAGALKETEAFVLLLTEMRPVSLYSVEILQLLFIALSQILTNWQVSDLRFFF